MSLEGAQLLDHSAIRARIAEVYPEDLFAGAITSTPAGAPLVRLLGRFTHWCSVYGGCQACLAGELAVRQDLFRARDADALIADHSVDVATGVFFGAIDEFGDREFHPGGGAAPTHRSLAQATLIGLARRYGCDLGSLRQGIAEHAATRQGISWALRGYGVNQVKSEPELFRALGFHLATETLADQEFVTLDRCLRTHHPDVVDYLRGLEVQVGGKRLPAYLWVSRHTVADAEHFDAALLAANLALRCYAGSAPAQVRDWILQGVGEAAALEDFFMRAVATD